MARTKSGSKGSGFEFWSRRPMSFYSGTWAKRYTHHIERRDSKALVRNELKDLE